MNISFSVALIHHESKISGGSIALVMSCENPQDQVMQSLLTLVETLVGRLFIEITPKFVFLFFFQYNRVKFLSYLIVIYIELQQVICVTAVKLPVSLYFKQITFCVAVLIWHQNSVTKDLAMN